MSIYKDKTFVRTCGIVTRVILKQTRSGASMAFVTVEDLYGSIEVIVFAKALEKYAQFLYDGSIITIAGNLSLEGSAASRLLKNYTSNNATSTHKGFILVNTHIVICTFQKLAYISKSEFFAQIGIFIHRVTGKVKSRHFLFHFQKLSLRKFINIRNIKFKRRIITAEFKKTNLTVACALPVIFNIGGN